MFCHIELLHLALTATFVDWHACCIVFVTIDLLDISREACFSGWRTQNMVCLCFRRANTRMYSYGPNHHNNDNYIRDDNIMTMTKSIVMIITILRLMQLCWGGGGEWERWGAGWLRRRHSWRWTWWWQWRWRYDETFLIPVFPAFVDLKTVQVITIKCCRMNRPYWHTKG